MSSSDHPRIIDGFTSVQALRRSGRGSEGPRTRPSSARLPGRTTGSGQAEEDSGDAPRIGHTVQPHRYEIECYGCGYAFKLTGRLGKTYCPKCRQELKADDYRIDTEWKDDITTIGCIQVVAGGALRGVRILARELIVAGHLEDVQGYVFGRIELRQGASFDLSGLKINNVVVAKGGAFNMRRKLECNDLEVAGELNGRIRTHGLLRIHPGGCLKGNVQAPHLVVEDGGGLIARLNVGGPGTQPPKPA